MQAVFCVNDDVAITLYEEMKKRSLVPGKDIYVFGYDNSVQVSKVNPTLSSVWTDTNRLGEEALSLLVRMMKGEKAESIVLPGKFVLRESVGRKRTQLDIPTLAYQEQIASYVDLVFYSCRSEFPENEKKAEVQLEQGKLKPLSVTEKTTPMEKVFQFEAIAGGRFSAVTLPIFSNEILYGFFVCDLTPQLFDNAEFLVSQISSAAKMIDLLNANERIQQKLEESLSALKVHNIELDNLSKSDALTGIMNRRGFYTEAERLLEELKQRGNGALFAYIDMNNLKIINDRYGHEEGDFSLKLIGSSLSSIMDTIMEHYGKKGIVGRIGGDEYACVIECTKEDWGSRFTDMTMELFDAFNRTSDKDYTVTVSVGTYQLPAGRSMELQEALSRADESLYEAKKHRVKSVAKMYKNALEKL